jgi:flavin-dependent dehydrogenase
MRVTVLGAGPAGSTAALFLAEAGVEVELVDRVSFPRVKPCAGGLFNPEQYLGDFPYVEEADGTAIHRILFRAGMHAAEHVSKRPLFKTTVRKEFDHFLLKKAIEKGAAFRVSEARCRVSEAAFSVARDGAATAVPPGGGKGGFVIDARGARRPDDYPACGVCMVQDFVTGMNGDAVHIHYGFMGIKGYCWVYPKKGYVNIGVGAYLPRRNIREVFEGYIDFVISQGAVSFPGGSGGLQGTRPLGALLPFAPRRRFHTGPTLLAGDAAGFVNPSSGEGIYFAMLSGKLAARALIEKRTPAWYEGECRRAFGRYLKPVRFGWSTPLLNRVLEKAVEICGRDERLGTMVAENFARFEEHNLTGRFLRGLLFCR